MNTLFLTSAEITILKEKFPNIWKKVEKNVQEEVIDSFESEAELARRKKSGRFEKIPGAEKAVQGIFDQLSKGGKIQEASFEDIPEQAIPALLYNMGARGVSVLIELSFNAPGADSDENLEGVAALTRARHSILQSNAVFA